MRPRVFVASSSETIDLATAVQQELEREAEVTIWSQNALQPSRLVIDSLLSIVNHSDFGVFVFSPTDVTKIRSTEYHSVRDNVLYELGLFTGRLGRERAFILLPRGVHDLRVPTDLLGLICAEYDPDRQDHNLRAAIGGACLEIRNAIRELGRFDAHEALVRSDPMDLSPKLRQTVKSQNSMNGEFDSWEVQDERSRAR